jgi:exonuclease SbcC
MIPISLRLRNFMCYTDVHEPLHFDGIRVACISGANGHGKSALFDAMTWALWGQCRARSDDELIHTGRSEAEVEFEFQLGDGRYRVLRKRSRLGRGQTTLELHAVHGNGLRPLTGHSVRDTQRRIIELLRMNYETFVHSSFLLQGRADAFTTKPPGERKRILAEILELGRYDELEDRAREAMKARDEAARDLQRQIEEIEQELRQQPEYEAQRAQLERARAETELALSRAQTVLQVLQERQAQEARARAELERLEQRLADGRRQLAAVEQRVAEHRARVRGFEAVLADAAAIDAGYARLVAVRAEAAALAEKAAQALALEQERAAHQQAIERARGALLAKLEELDARLRRLEKDAARRPQLEAELARAEEAVARLETLQAECTRYDRILAEAQGEARTLTETNERLRAQFRELRQHRRVLAEADKCPYCLTPLDATSRAEVIARCEHAYAELETQGKANNARLAELQTTIAQAQAQLEALKREAQALERAPARMGSLRQALQQAQQAAEEQAACQAERAATAAALEAGDYAPAAQAALQQVNAQLAALAYDPAAHAALRQELAALEEWEARHRELERAREALPREQALLTAAEADAAGWRARLAEDERRAAELRAELRAPEQLEQELRAAEAAVRRLEGELRACDQQLGAVRQILASLEFRREERERLAALRTHHLEERGIYSELAQAFSKRGLQAMIIENVIPELEQEANALLARMTDNRMHLKLETQRDTKQGNTIETLDIKIADEWGTRNYELFSGGEAFRVNFALRIALSKLVARRAGASVQTLIIDEGFGTQDAEGLERLVEAIKVVQEDFEKIFVITHVPEMKEVFPVRIEVRKTPQGSVFQLV